MNLCSFFFGNSEFSLRLPNVLAHGLYLVCSLAIIRRFQYTALQIVGFVFLNLNPFVLTYFFVARGYGLALAFQMLSIYLMIRGYEKKNHQSFVIFLFLSTFAGFLSVLANFSFLNFYLPLLLVSACLLFSDATLYRFSLNNIRQAILLFSINGLFVIYVLAKLFKLQRSGLLFFGGQIGFIGDTVGSLVNSSLYSSPPIEKTVSVTLIGLFILLMFLALYFFFVKKEVSLFTLFSILLVSAVVLPILQHFLIHSLWPIDRGALYYVPLYVVTLLSALQKLIRFSNRSYEAVFIMVIPTIIALLICWNFYHNFNTHIIQLWGYDRHNDQVLKIIDKDRNLYYPDQIINIGNSWQMEPSLNFYLVTHNNTWLAPVTRNTIDLTENDYIYAFENEIREIKKDQYSVLALFPDTKTILLRVNQDIISDR